MYLHEYLTVLRRRWKVLTLTTLLVTALAVAYTYIAEPEYAAETEIFISVESGSGTEDLLNADDYVRNRVPSYARLMTSEVVLQPVIDELRLQERPQELASRLLVETPPDTVIISVTALDADPGTAAALANAVATSFSTAVESLEPARTEAGAEVIRAVVVEPASVPERPIAPQQGLYILLGLTAGLGLGVGLAVLRHILDNRIAGEESISRVTQAPVLGRLPAVRSGGRTSLIVGALSSSQLAEAIRQARTNIQFVAIPRGQRSFVITSALPGEGKTTSAINLALAHASAGRSVCLVDGDLRRPAIATLLGIEGAVGVTNVLIESATLDDVKQSWSDASSSIDVIAAGSVPPNPAEILGSESMDTVLRTLESEYDVVIVDSPPLLPFTDAAVLASHAAGAILVVGMGKDAVSEPQLGRAVESLRAVDARILGVVINRVVGSEAERQAHNLYASSNQFSKGRNEYGA